MTSGALLFWNVAIVSVTDGLLIGSCLFAWVRGGAPEKLGASLYLVAALISGGLVYLTGKRLPAEPEIFVDGSVALGFLLLALRYNKLWLGAAMLEKGAQLALYEAHLTDLVDGHIGPVNIVAAGLDAVSIMISLTIIVGVLVAMRRRPKPAQIEAAHGAAATAARVV